MKDLVRNILTVAILVALVSVTFMKEDSALKQFGGWLDKFDSLSAPDKLQYSSSLGTLKYHDGVKAKINSIEVSKRYEFLVTMEINPKGLKTIQREANAKGEPYRMRIMQEHGLDLVAVISNGTAKQLLQNYEETGSTSAAYKVQTLAPALNAYNERLARPLVWLKVNLAYYFSLVLPTWLLLIVIGTVQLIGAALLLRLLGRLFGLILKIIFPKH